MIGEYRLILVSDGLGSKFNDEKYFRKHLNRTFKVTKILENGLCVTDIEEKGEDSDYIHKNFLIVSPEQLHPI